MLFDIGLPMCARIQNIFTKTSSSIALNVFHYNENSVIIPVPNIFRQVLCTGCNEIRFSFVLHSVRYGEYNNIRHEYACLYFQIYYSLRKTVRNINHLCEVCEIKRDDISI